MNARRKNRLLWLLLACAVGTACAFDASEAARLAGLDAFARQQRMLQHVADAAPGKLPALFTKAQAAPAPVAEEFSLHILRRWGSIAHEAALAECLKITDIARKRACLEILGKAWAQKDPEAAIAQALLQPPGPVATALFAGIFETLAQQDPAQAYERLQRTMAGHPLLFYPYLAPYGRVMRLWCMRDPDAALAAVLWAQKNTHAYADLDIPVDQWLRENPAILLEQLARADADTHVALLTAACQSKSVNFPQAPELLAAARRNSASYLAGCLFTHLGKRDAPRAWQLAVALPQTQGKKEALQSVLAAWMPHDKAAATAALEALTPDVLPQRLIDELYKQFETPQSTDMLLARLSQLSNESDIKWAVERYLDNKGDLADLTRKIPELWRRKIILETAAWHFEHRDNSPARATALLEGILTLPHGYQRSNLLGRALAKQDAEQMIAWANEHLSGQEHDDIFRQALGGSDNILSAKLTPDLFAQLPESRLKADLIASLARILADDDPANALRWLGELPPGPKRNAAYVEVLAQVSKRDKTKVPALAIAMAKTLPGLQAQDARRFVQIFAEASPEKSFEWAQSLSDKKEREHAMNEVVRCWPRGDKRGLIERVEALESDPERQLSETSLYIISINWTDNAPQDLTTWIDAQKNSRIAVLLTPYLALNWPNRDPVAATRWLSELPEGDVRTTAIVCAASSGHSRIAPEVLFEWVFTLPADVPLKNDPFNAKRIGALRALFKRLHATSFESVEQYLARPEISAEELKELRALEYLKTPPPPPKPEIL